MRHMTQVLPAGPQACTGNRYDRMHGCSLKVEDIVFFVVISLIRCNRLGEKCIQCRFSPFLGAMQRYFITFCRSLSRCRWLIRFVRFHFDWRRFDRVFVLVIFPLNQCNPGQERIQCSFSLLSDARQRQIVASSDRFLTATDFFDWSERAHFVWRPFAFMTTIF